MLTADIQLDHQRQGTARTSKLGNIKEFSLFVFEFPQLMINIDKTIINLQFLETRTVETSRSILYNTVQKVIK